MREVILGRILSCSGRVERSGAPIGMTRNGLSLIKTATAKAEIAVRHLYASVLGAGKLVLLRA